MAGLFGAKKGENDQVRGNDFVYLGFMRILSTSIAMLVREGLLHLSWTTIYIYKNKYLLGFTLKIVDCVRSRSLAKQEGG